MGRQSRNGLKGKPVLFGEPDPGQLQGICDALNSEMPSALELRRLIAVWRQSGPNLQKMMQADMELWSDLQSGFGVKWLPSKSGRSHLWLTPEGNPNDKNSTARFMFVSLTLNPDWDKLGGPCARCQRYYLKNTAAQTVYCSRRCANAATAAIRTRERQAAEHQEKLKLATQAMAEWQKKKHSKLGWKQWVSQCHPEITPKFLTRAVNNGDLQEPSANAKKP